MKKVLLLTAFTLTIIAGCHSPAPDSTQKEKITIKEKYITNWIEEDNIDSPAFWSNDSLAYLFATAKSTNVIVVYDANNGEEIKRIGKAGTAPGEFLRPNGIAVFKNLLFVVERDNARLQILSIPEFESITILGSKELRKPYGIYVYSEQNKIIVFITDNYETADEKIPPQNELGERVWKYALKYDNNQVLLIEKYSFGDTAGAGVLRVVESIWADPANNNLFIADEDGSENNIKVYDLDGRFKRLLEEEGIFKSQPEGIVLYECKNNEGFWIITDQSHQNNIFNVFDRTTFKLLGRFKGQITSNTDGIALTQKRFGSFTSGAFFAVHNDGGVSAFDLKEILDSLKITLNCTE